MSILAELNEKEAFFHRPEKETSRADFEKMVDPAVREVGASGRCYSREDVLDVLERRAQNPTEKMWKTGDVRCAEIAEGNYLLTYILIQNDRHSRRSSI